MVSMDRTSAWHERQGRRRSEPVHIREVIAEIWAVFESRLPAVLENLQDRSAEAASLAQTQDGAELVPTAWTAQSA